MIVHDAFRCQYILPSGERVTEWEWEIVVHREAMSRLATVKGLPPRPTEIDPLLPARVVNAWKARYRRTLAAFEERQLQAAHDLASIYKGQFTLKDGRFELLAEVS